MKKYLSLLCIALLTLASCDKIEENNYIIYSGAEGEWMDGTGVSDQSQRALIEKYTGVRCVNCPKADTAILNALQQYGDKLIAVSIHDSNMAFTRPIGDSPDLRTPDGHAWSYYFGVLGLGQYPSAMVNRALSGGHFSLFTPTSGINDRVDAVINGSTQVAVAVTAQQQNGGITIDVNLEYVQQMSDELTLTLMLMEDGIVATQRQWNGADDENYVHNHVLRDVITDLWGADIDADGKTGTKRHAQFTYTQAQSDWNLDNCHVVAFVSKKSSREIVNVAECEVE